jgi:soluble lytic murein transglycosylase-like protein
MVRSRPAPLARAILASAVIAAAGPAAAQALDWRPAGGAIFAATGPAAAPGDAVSAVSPAADFIPPADQPYDRAVRAAAEAHGLDPKLLHALVVVESGYRPTAVSAAGAAGLTQLMAPTAADLGVADRFDPEASLAGGAAYLARQVRRFGDLRLALAAFNAGPDRVARLGRVPSIPETRTYVAAVLDCYLALSAGRKVRSARQCAAAEASQ